MKRSEREVKHRTWVVEPAALRTCRLTPGAGMGRMVAVSLTPRGTGTAGLLSMTGAPLPESGAGA